MKPVAVPDLTALPELKAPAAARDARLAKHNEIVCELATLDRRTNELQRAPVEARDRRAASVTAMLQLGSSAAAVAEADDIEGRRRSLAALERTKSILRSALPESEKLCVTATTAFDEAGCTSEVVVGPLRAIQKAKIGALCEAARLDAAELDYRHGLEMQGLGTSGLPDLRCPWLGDVRSPLEGGYLGELLIYALERGIIESADVPQEAHPCIQAKGLEERAQRARDAVPLALRSAPPAPVKKQKKAGWRR